MRQKRYQRYLEKKQRISGKRVVGIDPAKERHQVDDLCQCQ